MVLIPIVMDNFDYPLNQSAFVLQLHSIGMFAPGILLGFLIEKFGTIIFILIGLIILMASNLVMIFGTADWNFLVGMFLCGVGWNLTFVSGTTTLVQTYRVCEKKDFYSHICVLLYSSLSHQKELKHKESMILYSISLFRHLV